MDIRFPDKGGIGSLGGKGTVPSPLQQQILAAVQHNTSVVGPWASRMVSPEAAPFTAYWITP